MRMQILISRLDSDNAAVTAMICSGWYGHV